MKKSTKPAEAAKPELTYVIVAPGPSLDDADVYAVDCARDIRELVVIAVGDAYRRTSTADMVYACDYDWWAANIEAVRSSVRPSVRLVTIDPAAAAEYTLELIPCLDLHKPDITIGLSGTTDAISSGCSSGYQALHIAANEGAKRVLLLGYDYGGTGQIRGNGMPSLSDFPTMLKALDALAVGLGRAGVQVINCTPCSAVSCFPRGELADVL